jgi:hypothetical protein
MEFRVLACAAIYRHKPTNQRRSDSQDEFEYLCGLHEANLSRKDAKDASLSARWDILWRWWSWKKTAVAWAMRAIKYRDLTTKSKNCPVHKRCAPKTAGIGNQVAGAEIVGSV